MFEQEIQAVQDALRTQAAAKQAANEAGERARELHGQKMQADESVRQAVLALDEAIRKSIGVDEGYCDV